MKKSKIITLILSLSMIVAISMSTIAFAEGSGENWQGREYYKTHYISTNALVKDNSENAPSRFFLQADMPIELTLLGQDSSLEPNQLQSIRIKGASSSARNMPQGTVIYGDMYEGYNHITSIDNYNITANNSFAEVVNSHLSDSSNFYNMTSDLLNLENDGYTNREHSVFTTGYGVIRSYIPVFDSNDELTEYTTQGMIDYFSQYTYFSENPYIPYTCFTVGAQPLDLSSDIYYKECYYYGYRSAYDKYYMVDGNQIGAFRVYCWSNSSEDLTDNTLTSGLYLLMPSSIPSILVTRDMVSGGTGTSIHLSYTSALGTQLDNVSQSWYNTGYTDGNIFGYNQGYNVGYDTGVDIGYDNGLSDGRLEQTFTFERLIFTVLETPVKILLSTFDNITILGLDVKVAITSILTLTLILFVVRFVGSLFQADTTITNANESTGGTTTSATSNLSRDLNAKKPNRTIKGDNYDEG